MATADIRAYPAMELFLERVSATIEDFDAGQEDLAAVASICRDLDGVPLAIEMAAAGAGIFGIKGLAEQLDERFLTVAQGRAPALPRHKTIAALLDWSYELLSEAQQLVLRRLSVFRTRFDEAGAVAVAGGDDIAPVDLIDHVSELVAKSLLIADVSEERVYYRLPAITRVYASGKLAESGEADAIARRHAVHCREALEAAEVEWNPDKRVAWLATYGPMVDDIRAGLDWAFSSQGDVGLGLMLTAAFCNLAFRLWLIDELRGRIERALNAYPFLASPRPLVEAKLALALGILTQQTRGPAQSAGPLSRALDIADQVGLADLLIGALAGAFAQAFGSGDYKGAEVFARRFAMTADTTGDPGAHAAGRRQLAQAQFYLGNHRRALELSEDVLRRPIVREPSGYFPIQLTHAVSMRILKARSLWLVGRGEEAVVIADEAMEHAMGDAAYALSQALGMAAIPIALWRGENDRAAQLTERLTGHSERYGLVWWRQWAGQFAQILRRRGQKGQSDNGVSAPPAGAMLDDLLSSIEIGWCSAQAVARVEAGVVGWNAPEIWRAQAMQLLAQRRGADPQREAEAMLSRSVEMAQQQGMIAWELRSATSLARLWAQTNRSGEAKALLAPVYGRIIEGLQTADALAALELLSELDA
jgi:predicted ATPase